jgi:alkylation response protein AidB-like acyl-CoA dehydrogenase
MPLAITEDHRALAEVVGAFTAANSVRGTARAVLDGQADAASGLWSKVADQGWLGLHVPEEYGGSGYGLAETAVVADELGYGLSPSAFLPSAVASAVLAEVGSESQRKTYLPGLTDGSLAAGVLLSADLARSADGSLDGSATGLGGGPGVGLLLVVTGADLLIIPVTAGVRPQTSTSVDPALGVVRLSLSGLRAGDDAVVAGGAAVAVRVLRTLAAAEAVGGARACLDMAVEYAKVREQFGRTIGTFQAVKHHLADMLVRLELATALTWDAAQAGPGEQGEIAAAAAASFAFTAYQQNAQKNIQLHGGIGFTWEHDAHLYLRRAVALRTLVDALGSAEDDYFRLAESGVVRASALELPPEAEQYRAEARAFVERYRATDPAGRRTLLAESGYLVPHWPTPFGRAAGPVEQLVLEQELVEVEQPSLGIGGWVLLTLTQTASDEQIERWIPRSLAGEYQWCQLFSEPNAGSDAAAVQTRGERVDGGWRVNGQKVWTSGAQNCNIGLATIRTDPQAPKHKGITAMVIDLTGPGVEVRPLREITGESMFNEVFFDDVFVPDADVVGEINDGWRVARTTLGNERVSIGGGSRDGLPAEKLLTLVSRYRPDDVPSRRAVATAVVEEQAMRLINLRQVTRAVIGSGPGPEGNVTKLLSAEHAQRVTELAVQLAGLAATVGDAEQAAMTEYLFDRCLSIAGGTSEITRNVIAERILGLPRDPLVR